MCGLKHKTQSATPYGKDVTPYVGVWIETPELLKAVDHCQVTPYVGVWIETSDVDVEYFINSHTLRGCVD